MSSASTLSPPAPVLPRRPVPRPFSHAVPHPVPHGSTAAQAWAPPWLLAPFDHLLAPALTEPASTPDRVPPRHAVVAALNGVLGDHLHAIAHPLAQPLQLRQDGRLFSPLQLSGRPPRRVLLLLHDLCRDDLAWCRNQHDHGRWLATALDAEPVYVLYNAGLPIARNGRALALAIDQLQAQWPGGISRLDLLGHGMGGQVARSALAQGAWLQQAWLRLPHTLTVLGTPLGGLPPSRLLRWLPGMLARELGLRAVQGLPLPLSAGMADLCSGRGLPHAPGTTAAALTLPNWAVASLAGGPGLRGSQRGDGLVGIDSALGRHPLPGQAPLPEDRGWLGHGIAHMDLLCDPAVARRLLSWLQV